MAHCLDSAGHSRSSPHKQLQQTATTTLKRPWVCHSGCKRSSIGSFQTLGPLDAWVTNRFRGAGTSKAQGQFCSSRVWGVVGGWGDTRIVWSMSDREDLRNEGLAGGRGEMSRIWKQGLPAAYQHPPDCRRWCLAHVGLFFSFPIVCRCLDLKWLNSSEERTRPCAGRESCRMNGMQNWCRCLQTPQLYKFACTYESTNVSAALCLQLWVHVWMSHGSAQLVFWEMKRSLSLPFIWYRRWLEY